MIVVPNFACLLPWVVTSRAEAAQSFSHPHPKAALQRRIRPINSFINSSIRCPSSAVKFVGVQSLGSHFSLLCCSSFLTKLLWDFAFAPWFFWENRLRLSCFTLRCMFTGPCGFDWEHIPWIAIPHPLSTVCLPWDPSPVTVVASTALSLVPFSKRQSCNCSRCSLLSSLPVIHYWLPLPGM